VAHRGPVARGISVRGSSAPSRPWTAAGCTGPATGTRTDLGRSYPPPVSFVCDQQSPTFVDHLSVDNEDIAKIS
jgi:hypothetical protein